MDRDGQEKESGTIRRDPAGICSRRDDPRVSEETRGAPANGAASDSERDPPEKKKAVREEPKLGPVKEHIDRMLEVDKEAPRKGPQRPGSVRAAELCPGPGRTGGLV
jgi:hypothetical protein